MDPFKAALSSLEDLPNLFAGWAKGSLPEGAEGFAKRIHEATGLIPVLEAKVGEALGGPVFTKDIKQLISQLRGLEVTKRSPGIKPLESFVKSMNARQVGAGYRVVGAGTSAPYIQMELGRGGDIINLPFETSLGRVTQGPSTYAARRYIGMKGGAEIRQTFSQRLYGQILEEVPAGPEVSSRERARAIKGAIKSTSKQLLENTKMLGREAVARTQVRAQQAVIGKSHALYPLYMSVREKVLAAQIGANEPGTRERTSKAKAALAELTEEFHRRGYGTETIKWEQFAKRMTVNLPGVQFYPGAFWGDLNKNIHQLLGKEAVDPAWVRRQGFKRGVPEIMAKGSRSAFEVGANVGVFFGGQSAAVIGDSAAWVTSQKLKRTIAGFPFGRTTTVSVPAEYVHGKGTVELERRLGKGVASELRAAGAFEQLEKMGAWKADTPIFIKGAKTERGRAPAIIGQSLGIGPQGEIIEGKYRTLRKHEGISGIQRVGSTGVGGTRDINYKFDIVEDPRRVHTGRGLVGGGTTRLGAMRFASISGKGIIRPDLIIRHQEALKNVQAKQTLYASHWIKMARRHKRLGVDPVSVIKTLGLRPGTFAGEQTAFGGNEWLVTQEKVEGVKKLYKDALKNRGLSPAQQRRWIENHFMGHVGQLKGKELENFVAGYPEDIQNEIRREMKHSGNFRIFEGFPVGIRNVGSGLKMRYGARLRLDHTMMALFKLTDGSSPANIGVEAFAKTLDQRFREKLGGVSSEAANVLGALRQSGLYLPKGARRVALNKYSKVFNEIPRITGGTTAGRLAGTIVDPKFSGGIVDLPFEVELYHGSRKGLVAGTLEGFSKGTQLWLPSVGIDPIAPAEKGLYHNTKSLRLRTILDRALRAKTPDPEQISLAYSNYMLHLRSDLFGGRGRLNPKIRPMYSSYNALGLLSADPAQALDIGMTKKGIKARFGKEAKPILERLVAGEKVMLSAIAEPAHSPSTIIPAMSLRLIDENVLAAEAFKKIDTAKTVLIGQGAMFGMYRDQDLDRIAVFLAGDKFDPVLNKQLIAAHKRELGIYQHIQKLVGGQQAADPMGIKFPSEAERSISSRVAGLSKRRVEAFVSMASDKFEIPIANLFFRHRVDYAQLAARAQRGDIAALAELKSVGAAELAARINLTSKQSSALAAMSGMVQQTFIGKTKKSAIEVISAIRNIPQEAGPKDISALEKKILPFFQDLQAQSKTGAGKFIPPAKMNLEAFARSAAEGMVKTEVLIKTLKLRDAFNAGRYGREGATKLPEVIGRMLGETLTPEKLEGMYENRELRALLAEANKVSSSKEAIALLNAETKTLADYLPSSIKEALERKGIAGAFGQALSDIWGGKTWMGSKGGKAAIIGGAFVAMKGLADAFSGSDEISPMDGPVQNPAMTPLPAGYQPPSFALMGETHARIERPADQPFRISGAMQADNSLDFTEIHNTMMLSSGMRPGGYGYFEDRNIPVNENEMEIYIREKMRSSF